MSAYVYYTNENYEILLENNQHAYVLNKKMNSVHFLPYKPSLHALGLEGPYKVNIDILDVASYIMVLISIICSLSILISVFNYPLTFFSNISLNTVLLKLVFVVVNVVTHELAHFATMRMFGRSSGGFSYKGEGMYIGFSVDTTEAYLLPRYRRFIVFYSGALTNILLTWLWITAFPGHRFSSVLVLLAIIACLIPSARPKTDGYNILKHVFKQNTYEV